MEGARVAQKRQGIDLRLSQLRVRARLAGKAELAVARLVQRDERQRGEIGRIDRNAPCVDAQPVQRADQQAAERVRAHLADHGGLAAVGRHRGQEVVGRAAGMGAQRGIARRIGLVAGKVNEQLAQRNHVKHDENPLLIYSFTVGNVESLP